MRADDIPVAHTPPGGYGAEMPAPILGVCTEPLAPGAPDMRGTWRVVAVDWHIETPNPDSMNDHVERIEQCGDRVCITAGGVIHDMRADGTREHGVHDVAAVDGREIEVVATFEDGVHTLRPVGMADITVTRHLEGEQLVWRYGPMFTARLERVDN